MATNLNVMKTDPRAKLPTTAYNGDLGYDLYALEDTWIFQEPTLVRTGIACAAYSEDRSGQIWPLGLIIKDRSSMALKGLFTHGGVIDPGYRGELVVNLTCTKITPYNVQAGDKIAQMVPVQVLTGEVREVTVLEQSERGENKFGSSGR